ncbi:unnamed protein product [Paramecium pentaurelia]|uniref:Transmembrane protein n=1 Tax=Paramecium pentaurelia TaxID=43138 RepID=A0A8S1YNY3_9CILI|nr:unnamed protein product [Paramecium pentaurelia]
MNVYSYEAYKTDNQNDEKVFDVNDQNKLQLEYQSIQKIKDSRLRKQCFRTSVIQNFFILMMICFGLFTNMQFWLIDQHSDIIEFYYCGFARKLSQANNLILLFTYNWINYANLVKYWIILNSKSKIISINSQQHFLFILLFQIYCLHFGSSLIFLSWIIDFVIIFSTAFYTTKMNTQANYKIDSIFIVIPTFLFLIIQIFIYPDSALYIFLDCFIVIIQKYFIIAELIRFRNKEEFTSSILDIMIGSSLLFGSFNQCCISLIELYQAFSKKSI